MERKKALAYLGGTRQLEEFIWYYLSKGKEYDWTLVCQPMFKEMKLKEVCEKSGIFEEIIQVDSYLAQSFWELAKIGVKMGLYWISGQNKKYAIKEINKITDLSKYELMCVSTSRGVTPGLMILAADIECIDLMEDGLGDNTDENIKFEMKRLFEQKYFLAYWFAKMGYFNIDGRFPLKSTKKCTRYSAEPELLSKNLYKEVCQLNDMSKVNKEEYDELIDKTFGEIDNLKDFEAILFTTPLKDFTSEYEKYNNLVVQYLKDRGYKKVALKKHPRDLSSYYDSELEMTEINPMIPAEKILKKIVGQDIYFMFSSTAMKGLEIDNDKIKLMQFKDLLTSQLYSSCFNGGVEKMGLKKEMIIEL